MRCSCLRQATAFDRLKAAERELSSKAFLDMMQLTTDVSVSAAPFSASEFFHGIPPGVDRQSMPESQKAIYYGFYFEYAFFASAIFCPLSLHPLQVVLQEEVPPPQAQLLHTDA